MKADYVLSAQDLEYLLKGGTLPTYGYNFVKGSRQQLLAWRDKFTPTSRKDKKAFEWYGGWSKISDYPEIARLLPPCCMCGYPFPITKHVNAFRNGEIVGNRIKREYTFVWCTECNLQIRGGLTGTQTVAFARWQKAWEITGKVRASLKANDLFYYPSIGVIDSDGEFRYTEPEPRHLMGKGNRINEEKGIIVFGEADFHNFLRDDTLFVSPYKYYRIGYQTLLNHRVEFNLKKLMELIELEEEIERRNSPDTKWGIEKTAEENGA